MTEIELFLLMFVFAAAVDAQQEFQVGCNPWVKIEMHLVGLVGHLAGELGCSCEDLHDPFAGLR